MILRSSLAENNVTTVYNVRGAICSSGTITSILETVRD